jgi:hypothetical protein
MITDLDEWAVRAGQALQEICDEAQEAAGNPDGEDQCLDLRELLRELDYLILGKPSWQQELAASDEGETKL